MRKVSHIVLCLPYIVRTGGIRKRKGSCINTKTSRIYGNLGKLCMSPLSVQLEWKLCGARAVDTCMNTQYRL